MAASGGEILSITEWQGENPTAARLGETVANNLAKATTKVGESAAKVKELKASAQNILAVLRRT